MSGHSKFANIKHKKEKNDAAKGKIFTKIGRELAVAVKEGGGPDPANNSRLRDVIAKAKSNNMPNDTIERNIKKAAGEGSGDNYEHITYEGYGAERNSNHRQDSDGQQKQDCFQCPERVHKRKRQRGNSGMRLFYV